MQKNNDNYSPWVNLFLIVITISIIFFGYQQLNQQKKGFQISEETKTAIAKAVASEFADQKGGFVTAVVDQVTRQVTSSVIEQLTKPKPNEAPDFQSLDAFESLEVAKNFESWTPDSVRTNQRTKFSVILKNGELGQAYLLIKASKGSRPLTSYDSVYMKFANEGGHIYRPQTLPIPERSLESGKTTLLFSFQDIPYLASLPYSETRAPEHLNLLELFRSRGKVDLLAFISSLQPSILEEITIFYKCKDAQSCNLSLE